MKVLLFNGSPHKQGCTYTALKEIARTLKEEGIGSEIYHIGSGPLTPCKGCFACASLGKCIIEDDDVNNFAQKCREFDGFIFGSPVHYGAACGGITTFLDRVFFSTFTSNQSDIFSYKPAAVVVSARRSGATATLDQLNKYLTISGMPIISGRYWNMVHGHTPNDVNQDLEGLQNLRAVARNMAWFLKLKAAGEKVGIQIPEQEDIIFTNFIR